MKMRKTILFFDFFGVPSDFTRTQEQNLDLYWKKADYHHIL